MKVGYKTGLQKVDRTSYHFSIEARALLFDRRLVEFSFEIPHEFKMWKKGKMKIDKWILRKAFENEIPTKFIRRREEKNSEGVGSRFLLRDFLEKTVSDNIVETEKLISPFVTLRSKEEFYY